MIAEVLCARLVDTEISGSEHEALVRNAAAGAVVVFVGVVRDHDHGESVVSLHYSSHPSAESVLEAVVAEVVGRADGVRAVAVSHRIGDLVVGDTAFVVAVSADHRRAAFAACADLVEEVKARLPVWKRQVFVDGRDEWVGMA